MKHKAFFRAVNSVKLNLEKVSEFLESFPPLEEEKRSVWLRWPVLEFWQAIYMACKLNSLKKDWLHV